MLRKNRWSGTVISLLGRPQTPEPTMGMNMDDLCDDHDEEVRGGMYDPDLLSLMPASSQDHCPGHYRGSRIPTISRHA